MICLYAPRVQRIGAVSYRIAISVSALKPRRSRQSIIRIPAGARVPMVRGQGFFPGVCRRAAGIAHDRASTVPQLVARGRLVQPHAAGGTGDVTTICTSLLRQARRRLTVRGLHFSMPQRTTSSVAKMARPHIGTAACIAHARAALASQAKALAAVCARSFVRLVRSIPLRAPAVGTGGRYVNAFESPQSPLHFLRGEAQRAIAAPRSKRKGTRYASFCRHAVLAHLGIH